MAKPRHIVQGATYLVSRRVSQRAFRLRPDPLTNEIMLYCLAWAAAKIGILVLAVVVMSTHHHLVVCDPLGRLPDFLREFHRFAAKAMNAAQGQWENLWSAEHTSVVLLPTVEDALDMIGYTVANPVAAGLVAHPEQWPGVLLWEPGTSVVVRRPPVYFDPNGAAPEALELAISAPPSIEDETDWERRVRTAVAEEVSEARKKILAQGFSFKGVAAVLRTTIHQRAESCERKRETRPELAARDISVRRACLGVLRQFRRAYLAAMQAWKAGERFVAFPFGTWWMRVHHGAEVLPARE